jgi:hypothetical protein
MTGSGGIEPGRVFRDARPFYVRFRLGQNRRGPVAHDAISTIIRPWDREGMTTPEQSSSAESGADDDRADRPPERSDDPIDESEAPGAVLGRPRVITAEISRDRGWKSMVHVVLERGGQTSEARQDAIGEEIVLLRCAAETTLDALHGLLGGTPRFALVGAKRVLAFDSAVILTCVRTVGGRPRKLIGCVPISEDPVLAVARAILHATNRIVEALPNGERDDADGTPAESEP